VRYDKLVDGEKTLSVVFAVSLVTANIVATKIAFVGGYAVPAGFVGIGVAFLCSDLLGELYGREAARKTVNATLVGLIVAWGLVYSAVWMKPAPFYPAADAFQAVLGASGTIVTASVLTMAVSQNLDVEIFHRLKTVTDGEYAWVRNLGSTTVSQFVDTSLFIILGFVILPMLIGGTTTPLVAVPSLIIGQYVVKLVVAGLDTPFFYVVRGVSDRA